MPQVAALSVVPQLLAPAIYTYIHSSVKFIKVQALKHLFSVYNEFCYDYRDTILIMHFQFYHLLNLNYKILLETTSK